MKGAGHGMLASAVFSRQNRKAHIFFFLADVILVWLTFEAAYATRVHLPLERAFSIPDSVQTILVLFALFDWVLVGTWLGLPEDVLGTRWRVVVSKTVQQTLGAGVLLILFEFFQRLYLSRPFLILWVIYTGVALLLARAAARRVAPVMLRGLATRRYLYVVGEGVEAERAGRLVETAEEYGLELRGFFGAREGSVQLAKTYPMYPLERFESMLRSHVIDEVIVAAAGSEMPAMEDLFLLCDEEGVRTRLCIDFFPHLHSSVYLERLHGTPLLTFSSSPHDEVRMMLKRTIDFVLASVALVLVTPLLLLVAILVKLSSAGPVIFRQERCGLNGRRFTCYKFRTMVEDAESMKAGVAHLNVKQLAFKIPNDPRLTGVGRWLRKFSIDEFPQLWNVVKGEMSLVGPRPAIPEEVAQYKRWQRRRLRMRPGLTCLWTLAGRDALDFEEWMKLDLAYIDSWSLLLDWSIMLRTVPHVLTGKGAN